MKLSKKQKTLFGLSVILLFLILTNPSAQAFKEHIGANSYSGIYKEKNFFVASVYRYRGDEYLAFIGNFIEESKPKQPMAVQTSNQHILVDTNVENNRIAHSVNYEHTGNNDMLDNIVAKHRKHAYNKLPKYITPKEVDSILNGKKSQ